MCCCAESENSAFRFFFSHRISFFFLSYTVHSIIIHFDFWMGLQQCGQHTHTSSLYITVFLNMQPKMTFQLLTVFCVSQLISIGDILLMLKQRKENSSSSALDWFPMSWKVFLESEPEKKKKKNSQQHNKTSYRERRLRAHIYSLSACLMMDDAPLLDGCTYPTHTHTRIILIFVGFCLEKYQPNFLFLSPLKFLFFFFSSSLLLSFLFCSIFVFQSFQLKIRKKCFVITVFLDVCPRYLWFYCCCCCCNWETMWSADEKRAVNYLGNISFFLHHHHDQTLWLLFDLWDFKTKI